MANGRRGMEERPEGRGIGGVAGYGSLTVFEGDPHEP